MARRGRPPLKAETIKAKAWEALLEVQGLVSRGARPNAAAVLIANEHWRDISKNPDAAIQWLKRNQRIFSGQLIDALSHNGRALLLEFKRRNPRWTVGSTGSDLNKS